MGDQRSRKYAAVSRLRNSLHKKRESLADQFEFKMFVSIHFYRPEDKKTKSALYECSEIQPVMTNNYEQCIMEGVKKETYSYESSRELIDKDIVQFHTHNWKPLRRDMQGSKSAVDLLLWPRNDIETIQCHLFSRWKDDHGPFRHIDCQFVIQSCEYEPQLKHLLTSTKTSGLLTVNRAQTTFLFVDKHHFRLEKDGGPKAVLSGRGDNMKRLLIFRLRSLCLYLPQDKLMNWGPSTAQEWLSFNLVSPRKPVKEKPAQGKQKEETEDVKVEKGSDVSGESEGANEAGERGHSCSADLKENERNQAEDGPEEVTVVAG